MRTLLAILGCLVFAGWNCTLGARDKAPESTSSPANDGTVHGSILLTAPTENADAAVQKVFDSLRSKKYNAKIRRFIVRDSAIVSATEFVGDTYDVPFEPEIESPFVISAPAGTYSVIRISSTSLFERSRLCMQFPASFHIYPGKDTYVGQMTIAVGFVPYGAIDMPEFVRKTMKKMPGPKGVFTAVVSVVEKAGENGFDTQLMSVREKQPLDSCEKAPIPRPPAS